jgi:hypothetical protein
MRANRGRKFNAPQLLNEKETAKQSESDDDDIPFSEIREKVRAETQGSDSQEDNIPFSQIQTKTTICSGNTRQNRTAPGRVPLAFLAGSLKKTPRTSWTADDAEDPNNMVGCKIARDFGDRGFYLGEVIRIEYDSDDEDKVSIKTICTSF